MDLFKENTSFEDVRGGLPDLGRESILRVRGIISESEADRDSLLAYLGAGHA